MYHHRVKKRVLILGGALVILFLWYQVSLRPLDANDGKNRRVTVPAHLSAMGIGDLLAKDGIIGSPTMFFVYAKVHGASLKAGDYLLSPSMGIPQIVGILGKGISQQISVTIPEGFTVKDIDALLADKGVAQAGDVLGCARACDFSSFGFLPHAPDLASRGGQVEGYLFPDTYFVDQHFELSAFLARLLRTFQAKVALPLKSDIAASGHSLNDVITMASLVEAEAKGDEERAMVAGILWKRLRQHMILGVDASVRYVLSKPTGPLTESDLGIDSPYNLRKKQGLSPGPIGNPGIASIRAALHPKDSQYFYYLHDKNGQIHYAVTNDEQNANRAKYLP